MGSKYVSQSSSGYNASPPSDDGTVSPANKVTWATIKTKLPDPLKTFIEAINTQLVTAFDYSATAQASSYTTAAADHQKPIEVTGTTTISLGDAASMTVGYQTTIVNKGTATVTVALITGGNTLDGVVGGSTTLFPNQSKTFSVNQAANGYNTLGVGNQVSAIGYVFDGGGAVLATGVKGDLLVPFACKINSVTLEADQSGSIVIDIWKKTYTLDSPPTVANTITAAALPTLASHQSSQDTTLTGWTTGIAPNDMLRFNINSVTTCQRVTLTLKVTKT